MVMEVFNLLKTHTKHGQMIWFLGLFVYFVVVFVCLFVVVLFYGFLFVFYNCFNVQPVNKTVYMKSM